MGGGLEGTLRGVCVCVEGEEERWDEELCRDVERCREIWRDVEGKKCVGDERE